MATKYLIFLSVSPESNQSAKVRTILFEIRNKTKLNIITSKLDEQFTA
jgi:hypothetical protein